MPEIEWTQLPSGTLEAAQKRLGYTNEEMGRRLGRSWRTWRRWRDDDRVPAGSVPALARALDMPDLLEQFDVRVNHDAEGRESLLRQAEETEEQLLELLRQLRKLRH